MNGLAVAVAFLCLTFMAALVYVDRSVGLDVILETIAGLKTQVSAPANRSEAVIEAPCRAAEAYIDSILFLEITLIEQIR